MILILFIVPALIFFGAFAYFFHNPDFVIENRFLVSGPLFAVGIAPLFLFSKEETRTRLPKMLIWFAGMLSGVGLAAYLYSHLLDGWTP